MAATGEPYTVAARAISGRRAETGDDFLADRHVDLDAGPRAPDAQDDLARAMAQRVVDQVAERLPQP